MESKIRVYGKAQNRTALGIVNAYMVINPGATLGELRNAFPDSLNPDSGVKVNFKEIEEQVGPAAWNGFFDKEDELITMADGKKVALVSMWTKPSFERLVNHAKQYGIEVAKLDAAEKGFGKKGGYRLEYLNGFQPQEPQEEKKRSLLWLWVLLLLALLGIVAWLLLGSDKEEGETKEVVVEKVVEKEVLVRDTVYVRQIEDIQREYNAAQFAKGKSDLTDDAKEPLFKLADLMKNHPEIMLKIVGHTSAEGSDEMNQKLSEDRAKAACDFLVSRGIDAGRISYEGKGSSELLNRENPMAEENRRTEFIIKE